MSLVALARCGAASAQRSTLRRLTTAAEPSAWQRFWAWTTQPRPSWKEDKTEAAVAFCVFGITGSSSVAFVRPILRETTGIEGTMKDGPWSYRVLSLVCVSPVYACVLVTVGTAAGRHTFFANMANKIFGRFVPSALNPLNRLAATCAPKTPHLVPNMLLRMARPPKP